MKKIFSLSLNKLIVKILVLLLLAVGVMTGQTMAIAEESGVFLADIEKRLYGTEYAEESLEERLSRIETMVFGQAQTEEPRKRQDNLERLFSKNTIKTAKTENVTSNKSDVSNLNPPVRDATDYPSVTQLEQKLFKQSYTNEDISQRLTRLEKQIFKQTFEELPMVDRVDQLTLKVIPNNPLSIEENVTSSLPSSGQDLASSSLAIYSQLTTLEEQILGKTYGGELITNRLSRLERQILGSVQGGSVDSRMERLLSRYVKITQGQQQYNGNIGKAEPYTPSYSSPPTGLASPTSPKQVTVGPMLGGQSFSKEFIDMLPSAVQQQLGVNGNGRATGIPFQSQSEQIYSNPGTYTYQQQGVFIPYAMPPRYQQPGQITPYMYPQQQQSKNDPMRFPGGALGSIGQDQYYDQNRFQQQQGTYSFSPAQQGWEANINQSLVLLETAVFGRTFEGSNLTFRLNNLEQQVFGQTYPQYSFQQRITRLMKRSTYRQSLKECKSVA